MTDILNKIPDKSAVLIIGPPISNKTEFIYAITSDLLKDKPLLFVTTDHFPKDIEESLKKNKIDPQQLEKKDYLKFIDSYSAQAKDSISNTNSIKMVPGPLALNEISVGIAEIENEFYKKHKKLAVMFNSLSTLLIYSKARAVQRFIQVIIARTKKLNGTIFFTVEKGMHDEKIMVGLIHLMDAIITIDEKKITVELT